MTELLIKNMVCQHCVQAVRNMLDKLGYAGAEVELGKAVLPVTPDAAEMRRIDEELRGLGFELITDADSQLVEQAKLLVMHHVREEKGMRHNLSDCMERNLNVSYDTVSRIFSQKEGRTLEKYHIAQKIERVKELLQYGHHTLSEIADMVDYSSVAHLSRQFKTVTGMTPTEYLRGPQRRKGLNEV